MTAAKKFDLIKLDIEGEEKFLMEDEESKAVLCEATCVFMELHERFVKGCDDAFQSFMQVSVPAYPSAAAPWALAVWRAARPAVAALRLCSLSWPPTAPPCVAVTDHGLGPGVVVPVL